MKFYILFLFLSLFCHAQEILDVETLPNLRTQQYSMGPYQKIVVFSAPRTGSSLIYNVLRFLFEETENLSRYHNEFYRGCSVLKTHKYTDVESLKEKNTLYVVPIRHPLSASISTYRIRTAPIKNLQKFCKDLLRRQKEHLVFAEALQSSGRNVLFLKYEDFENNLDYLIDFFQKYFKDLSISSIDQAIMKTGYSKENIYSSIHLLPDFEKYLPISGFHGKHVILEKYTPPDEVLYWMNHYTQEAQSLYKKYGYFTE